ncbi:hypothetical protein AB0E06_19230 [Streptomyces sp. NPDC048109]|uniref:hypothetical protein n=1 Tax=unclassified Streptomyces TaxID=2593676 RepID=UPI0033D8805A
MKIRRTLLAFAVAPALLLTSACSGDSAEEPEKGKGSPTAEQSPLPKEKASQEAAAKAERIGAMPPKELEKAALDGTSHGFAAKKVSEAEVEAGQGMKADKAECQPLASLVGGFTHIEAVTVVHRSLEPTDPTNATIGSMWLASHSEKSAKQVMKDLRTSLKKCTEGFKTLGLSYTSIKRLKDPDLGNEAVSYSITSKVADQSVPMTYTVVREDGVIASFYGVNMLTPKKSAIPEAVIKDQLEQLDQ